MTNVTAMPGCRAATGEPNEVLVKCLKNALERAESGELQSIVATGFTNEGLRFSMWADHHINVYEMLGAISWLEHEYVHRHTEAIG
jgi:hypothetical protein